MGGLIGRPDIIDDHNQIVERVRKMEILPIRAIVPKLWRPSMGEPDAVAQFLMMIGTTEPLSAPSLQWPRPGPAAMFMWDTMMREGFATPQIGQDWTRFLQQLGLVPPVSGLPPSFVMSSLPGDAPDVGMLAYARTGGMAVRTTGWGPVTSSPFVRRPRPGELQDALPGRHTRPGCVVALGCRRPDSRFPGA